MRAFKKALMAFAAVTAVSAAFAATSFAEEAVEDVFGATADYDKNTVTITGGLKQFSEDDQVTVLLIKASADDGSIEEGDILYINQSAGDGTNGIFGAMGVLGTLDKNEVYRLKVGSDVGGDFTLLSFDFGGGEEDVWCDINKDYIVDLDDAIRLIQHLAYVSLLDYADTDEYVARCDVDLKDGVDLNDAVRLIRHLAFVEPIKDLKVDKKAE